MSVGSISSALAALGLVILMGCESALRVDCEGRPVEECKQTQGCLFALSTSDSGCYPTCAADDPECEENRECARVQVDATPEAAIVYARLCVPEDFPRAP